MDDEPEFFEQRGHLFDRDCICVYCRFDSAEWAWLRMTTPKYERDESPMPICEKP